MKLSGKYCFLTFILFLLFSYTNRMFLLTYKVTNRSFLHIDEKEIPLILSQIKQKYSKKWGYVVKIRSSKDYPGENDISKNYKFNQFGYCSFFNCLVFSNNFSKNEYRVIYYENYVLPFSDTKSNIDFIRKIHQDFSL
jgi:hypothetical protein